MNQLFEEPQHNIYLKYCDCRVSGTAVTMKKSLDTKYWQGKCLNCNKNHVESTPSKFVPKKKKIASPKFRGKSSYWKNDGGFQGAKE